MHQRRQSMTGRYQLMTVMQGEKHLAATHAGRPVGSPSDRDMGRSMAFGKMLDATAALRHGIAMDIAVQGVPGDEGLAMVQAVFKQVQVGRKLGLHIRRVYEYQVNTR